MTDCNKETAVILAGLIASQLGLQANRVFLYNQKWDIPTDEKLFVEVAVLAAKPFGASLGYSEAVVDGEAVLQEDQSVNIQEIFTVTLFSRDASARRVATQGGLTFALNGTVAQQLQEQYSFQIGAIPVSAVDVSATEASARLNKFSYTFNVLRAYSRQYIAESFDNLANPPYQLVINP